MFRVKVGLTEESTVHYAKATLRGPPVQGLHETCSPYTETSTPIFTGVTYCKIDMDKLLISIFLYQKLCRQSLEHFWAQCN